MGGKELDLRNVRPDEIKKAIETLITVSGLPHFDSESTGRVFGDLDVALR